MVVNDFEQGPMRPSDEADSLLTRNTWVVPGTVAISARCVKVDLLMRKVSLQVSKRYDH